MGGKRSKRPGSASGGSSASSSTYGSFIHLDALPPTSAEQSAAPPEPPRSATVADKNTIWEEYYPLIQPAHQYHHNGRGASNYFFHGLFSADVLSAYRDAALAFLVALFSGVVLAITGLVFCKQWGLPPASPAVAAFRALWTISPAIASLALRHGVYRVVDIMGSGWEDLVADDRPNVCCW